MPERSAQHGRRIDDDMEREVEDLVRGAPVDARARDELASEAPQTITTPLGDPEADAEHRELLDRSELARFLRPSALPAEVDVVLDVAREEDAPDAVLAELERLPRNVTFHTTSEIWEALGHRVEHRGAERSEPDRMQEAAPEPVVVREPAAPVAPAAPSTAEDARSPSASPWSPPPDAREGRLHPLRGAILLGLEIGRAVLGLADRALGRVQEIVDD